uniref:Protein kinase domain-containing protein n=1 Tax=Chlamydomonas leiostraca TaxID=1034604 RepID=A0A7S0RJE4_9CHLO|mmetsp:Transcript_2418/g.6143  ORF Transcript_2418/g.6143 Transcript_2418/m.6143 type:complete len:952 (+) Transcript_2418:178-3033(+)
MQGLASMLSSCLRSRAPASPTGDVVAHGNIMTTGGDHPHQPADMGHNHLHDSMAPSAWKQQEEHHAQQPGPSAPSACSHTDDATAAVPEPCPAASPTAASASRTVGVPRSRSGLGIAGGPTGTAAGARVSTSLLHSGSLHAASWTQTTCSSKSMHDTGSSQGGVRAGTPADAVAIDHTATLEGPLSAPSHDVTCMATADGEGFEEWEGSEAAASGPGNPTGTANAAAVEEPSQPAAAATAVAPRTDRLQSHLASKGAASAAAAGGSVNSPPAVTSSRSSGNAGSGVMVAPSTRSQLPPSFATGATGSDATATSQSPSWHGSSRESSGNATRITLILQPPAAAPGAVAQPHQPAAAGAAALPSTQSITSVYRSAVPGLSSPAAAGVQEGKGFSGHQKALEAAQQLQQQQRAAREIHDAMKAAGGRRRSDVPGAAVAVEGNAVLNATEVPIAGGRIVPAMSGGAAAAAAAAGAMAVHGTAPQSEDAMQAIDLSALATLNLDNLGHEIKGLLWIGQGGGGVVFSGTWQSATVAVKFMLGQTPQHVNCAALEAMVSTVVNHPNVVQTYGFDVTRLTDRSFMRLPSRKNQGSFTAQAKEVLGSLCATDTLSTDLTTIGRSVNEGAASSSLQPSKPSQPSGPVVPPHATALSSFNSNDGFGDPDSTPSNSWAVHQVLQYLNAAPGHYLTHIIMEHCDRGSLLGALQRGVFKVGGTSGDMTRFGHRVVVRALLRTARDIARGMHHLHASNIIHGDLKPGNVLLKGSRNDRRGFIAKVSDFGLAKLVRNDAPLELSHWSTITHMAPEVICGRWCKASDVYSFGILLWQLATSEVMPYGKLTVQQILVGVSQGTLRPEWPPGTHEALVKLGRACLQHDAAKRPSFQDIANVLTKIELRIRSELRAYTEATQASLSADGAAGPSSSPAAATTSTAAPVSSSTAAPATSAPLLPSQAHAHSS